MTRKVRDIMSAAPVCMAATESVSAAAKAMKERGIGTVLVVSGGRLEGLVTDRDITIRVLAENRDPATTRLGDICTGELAVLRPDDDVQHADPAGARARGAPPAGHRRRRPGGRGVHR